MKRRVCYNKDKGRNDKVMDIYERITEYKKRIDEAKPFEGDILRQLREYYRIGLTYTSNAIEGNSLTESETKVLLEYGLTVAGKPLRDTLEAIDHSHAYDYMFGLLRNDSISLEDIKNFHRVFYQGIDEKTAGEWRVFL
jgi:Fic family protein